MPRMSGRLASDSGPDATTTVRARTVTALPSGPVAETSQRASVLSKARPVTSVSNLMSLTRSKRSASPSMWARISALGE